MVTKMDRGSDEVRYGDLVVFEWGSAKVQGTIREVYGRPTRRQVVVDLTPEVSGYFAPEPTTISMPIEDVTPATAA